VTRIILIVMPEVHATYTIDDPRPPREVLAAINTGQFRVGDGEVCIEGLGQWAMLHPPLNVVTVVLEPPPVALTPRQYDVLFGLADGKTAAQIGADLGITARTVYAVTTEIKDRFGLDTKEEIIIRAQEMGLIE
jgi:DNA-binding CsgD family transcriptional regulator